MTKSDEAAGTEVRGAAMRFPCAGTGVEFGDIATGAAVITELTRKATKQGKPMASFRARNAVGIAAIPEQGVEQGVRVLERERGRVLERARGQSP